MDEKKCQEGAFDDTREAAQSLREELTAVAKQAREDEHRFVEERKVMRQKIAELEMTLDQKFNDMEELEVNLQKTRVDLVKAEDDQSASKAENEALKTKISQLQESIEELEIKQVELMETLEFLTACQEEAAAEAEQSIKFLEAERDDLAKEKEESIEELEAEKAACAKASEADTQSIERLKLEILELTKEKQCTAKTLQEANDALLAATGELGIASCDRDALTTEIKRLEGVAACDRDALTKEIKRLETNLVVKTNLLEDTMHRLVAAQTDIEGLESQLEAKIKVKKPFWQCG